MMAVTYDPCLTPSPFSECGPSPPHRFSPFHLWSTTSYRWDTPRTLEILKFLSLKHWVVVFEGQSTVVKAS